MLIGHTRQVSFSASGAMSPAARLLSGLPRASARRGLPPLQVFKNHGLQPDKLTPEADLAFTDHAAIFEGRTTGDLLRALLVLRLCSTPAFVRRSEALLDGARRLLGEQAAMAAVRQSFYKHFCAGSAPVDVWSRMNALRAHGIGAILDYAEEEDPTRHCKPAAGRGDGAARGTRGGGDSNGGGKVTVTAREPLGGQTIIESGVEARTYDYQDDDVCERHTAAFLAAIDTAAALPGQGFAAIQLTALGDPGLLEHLAAAAESVRALLRRCDLDGDGYVTRGEFEECYERLTRARGQPSSSDERSELWRLLDAGGEGRIDAISGSQRLDLRHMPALAASLERQAMAAGSGRPWELTESEQEALRALFERLERLVERAVDKGVKLMLDAEQSWLRPAIDHIAHELMRRHNTAVTGSGGGAGAGRGEAVIFVTYQAYLRDSLERLAADLARSQREGYTLGAKLVRGAYLHLERRRAAEAGRASPVWDRVEETHAAFGASLELLLHAVKAGGVEVMVGSHNQRSVEAAVAMMSRLGLDPAEAPVYFGQLMGMADHLSFTLGHHGYKVFKYCPYGSVEKVIPYLLRRVNEHQYAQQGGKQDVALLWSELWRRALHDPGRSPLARIRAAVQRGGGAQSSTT